MTAHRLDIFCPEAEDIDIIGADFLPDFNIDTVQGAHDGGAVERELHIARARGFHARSGDLFAQIGRRNDLFSQ